MNLRYKFLLSALVLGFSGISLAENKVPATPVKLGKPLDLSHLEAVQNVSNDAIKAKLAAYIDGAQTLSGDFSQVAYSARGEEVSKGTFKLKRPGKFAWLFAPPNEQQIISNGRSVYQYDVGLEQVVIRPRNEIIGGAAMNMLVGTKKLAELFTIESVKKSDAAPVLRNSFPNDAYFKLTSKNKDALTEAAWLVANDDGALKALFLQAGTGQITAIIFHHIVRNQPIADSTFDFKAPQGVDVIGSAN